MIDRFALILWSVDYHMQALQRLQEISVLHNFVKSYDEI